MVNQLPMSAMVRTYSGEVLARSQHGALGQLFSTISSKQFPLVGHVDLYDDTIFNRLQIRALLAELNSLISSLEGGELVAAMELVDLAAVACERPHRYLVISGD